MVGFQFVERLKAEKGNRLLSMSARIIYRGSVPASTDRFAENLFVSFARGLIAFATDQNVYESNVRTRAATRRKAILGIMLVLAKSACVPIVQGSVPPFPGV